MAVSSPLPADRPTCIRYQIVGLVTLMAVLLYLDRLCLSILEGYVREDLGIDKSEADVLLGVFFLAYALGQVPSGWLSDRYGARAMLALYILGWSVFTGLLGLAQGLIVLLLFRFGCGLFQAGAYPTSAAMISKWVPFSARGQASALVSTGGRIGGVLAPLLTGLLLVAFVPLSVSSQLTAGDLLNPSAFRQRLAKREQKPADRLAEVLQAKVLSPSSPDAAFLDALNNDLRNRELYDQAPVAEFVLPAEAWRLARIPPAELTQEQVVRRNRLLLEAAFPEYLRKVYGHGWRPVVLIYGIAGLVVAGLFFLLVRNRPEEHPGCNAAELTLISGGRPATVTGPHGKVGKLPLSAILESKSLWLSALSQFGTNFGWVFLVLLIPRYLEEAHQVPVVQRGWMASLPILIGMAGMLAGGWLTDRLVRVVGLRWGRRLPMALTRFVAMAAYLACLGLDSPWAVTAALCLVAVATDLGTASVWAFKQDIGGKHVGSVLGWGNMWGNFGAFVSPIALGWIIGKDRWDLGFVACACAFAVAGVAALGVDATVPIRVPEEKESP